MESAGSASYIIMKRDTAKKLVNLLGWLVTLLAGAGPSWARHTEDLRLARAEIQDSIDMHDRRSAKVQQQRIA